jgi:excinuclease ABC subunit B
MERRDVIVVATVSCIYGLGNPEDYREMRITLARGGVADRQELLRRLVALQYDRSDAVFERSRFRVRGDVVEVWPSYAKTAVRIELFGDEFERIRRVDPLDGAIRRVDEAPLPRLYFVMPRSACAALQGIRGGCGRHAGGREHSGRR